MFLNVFTVIPLWFFLINRINAYPKDLQSPCPRLFVYETKSNEPDKWYGAVTLLSEADLSGVWVRFRFDRPIIQLGNWFGEVIADNGEYLIQNPRFLLKANVPQRVRFYAKYKPNGPVPKLVTIKLNARTVCPEVFVTEAPMGLVELHTSAPMDSLFKPISTYDPEEPIFNKTAEDLLNHGLLTTEKVGDLFAEHFPAFNRGSDETREDKADLDAICGTLAPLPRPLIAYGEMTYEGEFPWHAGIYYAESLDVTYQCGASLISRYYVITVAHCVLKKRSLEPLNPGSMVVYLGKFHLKRFSTPGIQDRDVAQIIPHPRYNFTTFDNDIALVKFTIPAHITDSVRPVCLWKGSTDIKTVLNTEGSVVGWGYDESGKNADQLMKAKMPVVENSVCLATSPDVFVRFISNKAYCAGIANGASVCKGDAGGGMVFLKPNPKNSKKNNAAPVWQLRGITSFMPLHNLMSCDTTSYTVFTDTAKYLDWIKKSMKEP